MASDLEKKIIRQIEYYFGDINLPRDKFMQEKLKEDEGWITLEVLLTFKRLASLSTDPEVIVAAVEKSDTGLVEVSSDRKKLRRNPDLPLPQLNDDRKKELLARTAYVKGFPLEEQLNELIGFLEKFGAVESCHRRLTKDHKFKGSCFVVFKRVEDCKKFVEEEKDIKFQEAELIRKWQADYYAEKKKEYEERIKSKQQKKQAKLEEERKKFDLAKGAIIHFSGIPDGKTLTREEIKAKIQEDKDAEVSYIDFSKGDSEGYIRLSSENAAVNLFKKIGEELEVSDLKLKLRVLEGKEEELFLQKTADAVVEMRKKQKMSRKRKGNFNRGKDAKSKKNVKCEDNSKDDVKTEG